MDVDIDLVRLLFFFFFFFGPTVDVVGVVGGCGGFFSSTVVCGYSGSG